MSQPQQSIAIRNGEATNHVRADCAGETVSMYINDEPVSETHDSDPSSGDIGLWFRNGRDLGTDIVLMIRPSGSREGLARLLAAVAGWVVARQRVGRRTIDSRLPVRRSI